MNDPILFFVLAVLVVNLLSLNGIQNNGIRKTIYMRKDKFWSLVKSQDNPLVLLTTRGGGIFKKLTYVCPYQGILFVTDALGTSAPNGVKLIAAVDEANSDV
ncbi:MAG: hypothetical protein ACKPB4_09435 [Sphaerospermopsis kisseleviana]